MKVVLSMTLKLRMDPRDGSAKPKLMPLPTMSSCAKGIEVKIELMPMLMVSP